MVALVTGPGYGKVTTDTLRLNIGCGDYPLPGWLNIDEERQSAADVVRRVPPLPFSDASVTEIYAGHFFEHLTPQDARLFLDESLRALVPGGRLGLMVPDTREVMRRYIFDEPAPLEFPEGHHRDMRDLDQCCEVILFSTAQRSHHQWAYDKYTLARLLQRHGFVIDGEFDRFRDPRVAVGAWYQVGIDSHKP